MEEEEQIKPKEMILGQPRIFMIVWKLINKNMKSIYLCQLSEMSLVVLQLFPTLKPHRAGCMSPLLNKLIIYVDTFYAYIKKKKSIVIIRLPFTK
jgi:hypothetical protein